MLRHGGLNVVSFGEQVDTVVEILSELLGPPDFESVQVSPDVDRDVRWDEPFLYLQFTSWVSNVVPKDSVRRPVFHGYWTTSDRFATDAGVTVGSTVTELEASGSDVVFTTRAMASRRSSWSYPAAGGLSSPSWVCSKATATTPRPASSTSAPVGTGPRAERSGYRDERRTTSVTAEARERERSMYDVGFCRAPRSGRRSTGFRAKLCTLPTWLLMSGPDARQCARSAGERYPTTPTRRAAAQITTRRNRRSGPRQPPGNPTDHQRPLPEIRTAAALALRNETVATNTIGDTWKTLRAQRHLQRIVDGLVRGATVRGTDRNNLGTVLFLDPVEPIATVHFISPNGSETTKLVPYHQLDPLETQANVPRCGQHWANTDAAIDQRSGWHHRPPRRQRPPTSRPRPALRFGMTPGRASKRPVNGSPPTTTHRSATPPPCRAGRTYCNGVAELDQLFTTASPDQRTTINQLLNGQRSFDDVHTDLETARAELGAAASKSSPSTEGGHGRNPQKGWLGGPWAHARRASGDVLLLDGSDLSAVDLEPDARGEDSAGLLEQPVVVGDGLDTGRVTGVGQPCHRGRGLDR